ncbi:hypothetical protein Hanom_Chr07g00678521 [Helianthus anomalus]
MINWRFTKLMEALLFWNQTSTCRRFASLCIRCLQQRSCGLASFCKRHLR